MHVEAQDSCFDCYLCEGNVLRNAISMQYGADGFLVPRIDARLCNDCNICDKLWWAWTKALRNTFVVSGVCKRRWDISAETKIP